MINIDKETGLGIIDGAISLPEIFRKL